MAFPDEKDEEVRQTIREYKKCSWYPLSVICEAATVQKACDIIIERMRANYRSGLPYKPVPNGFMQLADDDVLRLSSLCSTRYPTDPSTRLAQEMTRLMRLMVDRAILGRITVTITAQGEHPQGMHMVNIDFM